METTFAWSPVSNQVQMITNKLVNGSAHNKAPIEILRLATSEAAVITPAEIINFKIIWRFIRYIKCDTSLTEWQV